MENIWTFKANDQQACADIEPKQFKTTSNFHDDIEMLCKNLSIKVHPALKKPGKPMTPSEESKDGDSKPAEEEIKPKELNTINFYKHRLDKNTLKVLFFLLPYYPNIHTLK
jgi:hypothetical protein